LQAPQGGATLCRPHTLAVIWSPLVATRTRPPWLHPSRDVRNPPVRRTADEHLCSGRVDLRAMSDDSLGVLWGCRSIANFINASEKKTYYLLEGGLIDATKVGDVWTSSKARLRAQFDMPRIERPPDSAIFEPAPAPAEPPAMDAPAASSPAQRPARSRKRRTARRR